MRFKIFQSLLIYRVLIIKVENGGMRWVWRGRIGKCVPNSEKLGVQYGPTAAGRRSVLHPQFRRMRFALSMCPSQTHRIHIVIGKLKPAISSKFIYPRILFFKIVLSDIQYISRFFQMIDVKIKIFPSRCSLILQKTMKIFILKMVLDILESNEQREQ